MDPNALLDDESEGESVLNLSRSRLCHGHCSFIPPVHLME